MATFIDYKFVNILSLIPYIPIIIYLNKPQAGTMLSPKNPKTKKLQQLRDKLAQLNNHTSETQLHRQKLQQIITHNKIVQNDISILFDEISQYYVKWENIVRSRSEDIVGFIRNYERNLLEKLEESRDRELTMIQPDVDQYIKFNKKISKLAQQLQSLNTKDKNKNTPKSKSQRAQVVLGQITLVKPFNTRQIYSKIDQLHPQRAVMEKKIDKFGKMENIMRNLVESQLSVQGDVHVEGCDDDDEGAHADQIVNMSVGIKDSRENVVNINDLLFEEKEQVKYIPKRTAYTKEQAQSQNNSSKHRQKEKQRQEQQQISQAQDQLYRQIRVSRQNRQNQISNNESSHRNYSMNANSSYTHANNITTNIDSKFTVKKNDGSKIISSKNTFSKIKEIFGNACKSSSNTHNNNTSKGKCKNQSETPEHKQQNLMDQQPSDRQQTHARHKNINLQLRKSQDSQPEQQHQQQAQDTPEIDRKTQKLKSSSNQISKSRKLHKREQLKQMQRQIQNERQRQKQKGKRHITNLQPERIHDQTTPTSKINIKQSIQQFLCELKSKNKYTNIKKSKKYQDDRNQEVEISNEISSREEFQIGSTGKSKVSKLNRVKSQQTLHVKNFNSERNRVKYTGENVESAVQSPRIKTLNDNINGVFSLSSMNGSRFKLKQSKNGTARKGNWATILKQQQSRYNQMKQRLKN